MHDALGLELKEGDVVLIPARIKTLNPNEDYCNVTVETLRGRHPDEYRETISAINTGVLFRFNPDDEIPGEEFLKDTGKSWT